MADKDNVNLNGGSENAGFVNPKGEKLPPSDPNPKGGKSPRLLKSNSSSPLAPRRSLIRSKNNSSASVDETDGFWERKKRQKTPRNSSGGLTALLKKQKMAGRGFCSIFFCENTE